MKSTHKKVFFVILYYIIAIGLRYYMIVIKPSFYQNTNTYIQGLLTGIGPLLGGLLLVYGFKRPNNLKIMATGVWKSLSVIILPIALFYLMGIFNIGKPYGSAPLVIGTYILYGFFEEYGWRGYLQTELQSLNPYLKYFIISVLWYFWHLNFGIGMSNLYSYFIILAGTIGIGYVAEKSKSLTYTALFHAFFNIIYVNSFEGISSLQIISILSISALFIIFLMVREPRNG